MRILALTPWVPSTRRPRSFGLLSALHEQHDVRLLAATWRPEDESDLAALPYPTIGVPMKRSIAITRACSAILGNKPLQQAYLNSPQFSARVAESISEFSPDLVYFNTLRSAQWRHGLDIPSERLIMDLDEFRSGYYDLISARSRNPLLRRIASLESRRMRAEEALIQKDYSQVLVSSPTDLAPTRPRVKLVRSPHALEELKDVEELRQSSEPSTIVFVGRMSYAANVTAILWFCREVLPMILVTNPNVRVDIVGDSPTRSIRRLASQTVRVHGRVPDVAEYYRRAAVSIIPVTEATGVQMKLIESLAMGTPVITTPLVAKQAGTTDGLEVTVAESASEWAQRTVELLSDSSRALAQAEAGWRWAQKNYATDAVGRSLHDAINTVAQLGHGEG